MPFSYGSPGDLLAHRLWVVPLSWLVLAKGRRDDLAVCLGVDGLAVRGWLLWPGGSHGLSGLIDGLLAALANHREEGQSFWGGRRQDRHG